MAAGRGSRLGSVTDDRPKALVDVGTTTPLELQLELLISHGVEEIVIVTGYHADMVKAVASGYVGDRAKLRTVWNPFWSVTNVLGSAWFARDLVGEDLLYLHADTVFAPSIMDDLLSTRVGIVLPVDIRSCEPEQMKAEIQLGRVTALSKDLPDERTAGEFIGIAFVSARASWDVFRAVDAELLAGGIHSYFEEALNRIIVGGEHPVIALATEGRPWVEIDFEEDLERARQLLPTLVQS